MTRFVVGEDRSQSTLFPERLDDYLTEDNPVRAIDVFVDQRLEPLRWEEMVACPHISATCCASGR
jgi:hypothetical protein